MHERRTAFEQRSRVYVHDLGQDAEQDRFVFGYGYSPDLKISDNDISFILVTPESPYLVGMVAHGTQNELTAYYIPLDQLQSKAIAWKKLFDVDAAVTGFSLQQDDVYLLTHKNKPRYEVTRTSLKNPDVAHATVVVPASEVAIQEADVAHDGVYIRESQHPGTPCGLFMTADHHIWLAHGHTGQIMKLDLDGKVIGTVRRLGVTIAYIKDRRALIEPTATAAR